MLYINLYINLSIENFYSLGCLNCKNTKKTTLITDTPKTIIKDIIEVLRATPNPEILIITNKSIRIIGAGFRSMMRPKWRK